MRLRALCGLRWFLTALFALLAATFVGLAVYAVLQFGLWWPRRAGVGETAGLLLAALTMLPFLLVFTKLDWSRPMGWLAARFSAMITPIDRRIEALRAGD
jgi:Zn-dependent protease with chaperone function